ncbi:MAG: cytochrome c biogenesis protein CcsA [Burkholderiales bacterium]|jgi:ABC-type uncharacterized transport system permease subunit|nr:cytochrome c biogenesis protein CcsA [Burkholderiales bacterium]
MIIPLSFFHFVVAALYAVGAWARWRTSLRPNNDDTSMPIYVRVFALLTLGLHACALFRAIATPDGIDISIGNATSLVAFLCVLVAWVSGLMRALAGFSSIVLGGAALAALMPALLPGNYLYAYSTHSWAAFHIAIAISAYALFFVAAMQALAMLGLEKRLHRGVTSENPSRTPPLLTLEHYLFRLITLAFVLLTLTLISGLFFTEEIFGKPFELTHKTSLSIIAWLIFGTLLLGRWRFGWRGRRALYWILSGTATLLLAYLGYKFIVEIIL